MAPHIKEEKRVEEHRLRSDFSRAFEKFLKKEVIKELKRNRDILGAEPVDNIQPNNGPTTDDPFSEWQDSCCPKKRKKRMCCPRKRKRKVCRSMPKRRKPRCPRRRKPSCPRRPKKKRC